MRKIIFLSVLMGVGIFGYSQSWTAGSGILYTNPTTTKIGIGITSPSELVQINGGALKIGNSSSATDRAVNMLKFGDGNYVRIGEWEKDDQLSLYAAQGFNFTGGDLMATRLKSLGHLVFEHSSGNGVINFGNSQGNLYFRSLSVAENINTYNHLMILTYDGRLGINTWDPGNYKLAVNGDVRAKSVRVETNWSDFVFDADYKLLSLSEVERFINQNNHLPEIPSAKEVEENGVSLGEMQAKLLQKIEELTLYAIEQQKLIEELQKSLSELKDKKGGE